MTRVLLAHQVRQESVGSLENMVALAQLDQLDPTENLASLGIKEVLAVQDEMAILVDQVTRDQLDPKEIKEPKARLVHMEMLGNLVLQVALGLMVILELMVIVEHLVKMDTMETRVKMVSQDQTVLQVFLD